MNKYLKNFIHRGLIFSGLGPVTLGIVYFCLDLSLPDFSLSGQEVLIAVVSTYILAFVQAGASVFNQIEHWPVTKSLFFHFILLYAAYSLCYIINTWIPFEPMILLIFTGIFAVIYFAVWITVYLCVRRMGRKLNERLN